MADLPPTLRVVFDAAGPFPRDVPLAEVYLDVGFPDGAGGRPFVYGNMVQTFDGQAVLEGRAYTIGTDVDHFLMRQLRVHADVVLYGAGTLRKDDVIAATHPALRERRSREGRPPNPPAIVVSTTAAFSEEVLATKKFFRRTDFERLIVTTSRARPEAIERVRDRGVAVEVIDAGPQGEVNLEALLRRLRDRGIRRVLCEGGPTLNSALARAGVLDELFVTTALRLGGSPDEPRIFTEPMTTQPTTQPLTLLSELHYVTADGVRELYFRFRFR